MIKNHFATPIEIMRIIGEKSSPIKRVGRMRDIASNMGCTIPLIKGMAISMPSSESNERNISM